MKKVFFIGMNRIATKSFHNLFNKSGYKSFHYSCADVATGESIILGVAMQYNRDAGYPVMHRMGNARVYSDMFWHRENEWIDGVKMYRDLHQQFPDAYFILQTRDMSAWLQSKYNHKKGAYFTRSRAFHGLSEQEMFSWFENDRNTHEQNVRHYFKDNDQFLEYDLDNDDISKLIDFVKPDFFLKKKDWGHYK